MIWMNKLWVLKIETIVIDWSTTVWCYSLHNITEYTIRIAGETKAACFEGSVTVFWTKWRKRDDLLWNKFKTTEIYLSVLKKIQKMTFEIKDGS